MRIWILIVFFCLPVWISGQRTWYVNQNSGGLQNGSSWTNAFLNLHEALSSASSEDQIWVAHGTYLPSSNGDRSIFYKIDKSISIYGGFLGIEASLDERNIEAHPTIFSGEISNPTDKTDNSYRLFEIEGTVLLHMDGLIIENVYGDDDGHIETIYNGKGAILSNNQTGTQHLRFENCTFRNNFASSQGAVFYYESGSTSETQIQFLNCSFSGNASLFRGTLFTSIIRSKEAKFILKDCNISSNDPNQIGNNYIRLDMRGEGSEVLFDGLLVEKNSMIEMEALFTLTFAEFSNFTFTNSRIINNTSLGQLMSLNVAAGQGSNLDFTDLLISGNNTFNPPIRISSSAFGQTFPMVRFENIEISHHRNTETWHLIDLKEVDLVKFDNCRFLYNWAGPLNVSPMARPITITNCLVVYNEFRSNDFSNQFNFNNDENHDIKFVNCTFAHNAGRKGSIVRTQFNKDNLEPSRMDFQNCIFFDNFDFDVTEPNPDRLVFTRNTHISFNYCLFDQPDCSSLVTIERNGSLNCDENVLFSSDPRFISNENFYLAFCSPAIDAGINTVIDSFEFDLDRNQRIQNNFVDLGAFENTPVDRYIGFSCVGGVIYSDWLNGLEQGAQFNYIPTDINELLNGIARYVLRSRDGCVDTLTFPVNELVGIDFLHNETYDLNSPGDTIEIGIQNFLADSLQILLFPETAFYTDNAQSTIRFNPIEEGKYYIAAINKQGCYALDSINVIIKDKSGLFYIANVLTPGSGSSNQLLELHFRGDDELVMEYFSVYDRLGNLVHSVSRQNFNQSLVLWDGKSSNGEILSGVYAYVIQIDVNGEPVRFSGDITVLK